MVAKVGRKTKPTTSPANLNLDDTGKREVRVGCLIEGDGPTHGRVLVVMEGAVLYRPLAGQGTHPSQPVLTAFCSEVTVLEGPPAPEFRPLPEYQPRAAEWTSEDDGIYHVPSGTDRVGPLVASVQVNPALHADGRDVLLLMAAAPELWRELRDVAAKYVWLTDHTEDATAFGDFARITELLIAAGNVFPWSAIDAHGDHKIDAHNTEVAAARAAGTGAVTS